MNEPDMLVRQIWPIDLQQVPRKEMQRHWRWIAWYVEPITLQQAQMHLRGPMPMEVPYRRCVVWVKRGPKGGWNDARFIEPHNAALRRRDGFTAHFGWVMGRERPVKQLLELPDNHVWLAHLELITPVA